LGMFGVTPKQSGGKGTSCRGRNGGEGHHTEKTTTREGREKKELPVGMYGRQLAWKQVADMKGATLRVGEKSVLASTIKSRTQNPKRSELAQILGFLTSSE